MSIFKKPKVSVPSYFRGNAPQSASSYEYPGGALSRVDLGGGKFKWAYQESPATKAARIKREALRSDLLSTLGLVSPEREKQISDVGKIFEKKLLESAQPRLEQTLIGKGLGGSSLYGNALAKLLLNAAQASTLQKENLYRGDEEAKLRELAAMEGGLGLAGSKAYNAMGLGISDLARNQALQNAYWQNVLGLNERKAAREGKWRQGWLGSLGDIATIGGSILFPPAAPALAATGIVGSSM